MTSRQRGPALLLLLVVVLAGCGRDFQLTFSQDAKARPSYPYATTAEVSSNGQRLGTLSGGTPTLPLHAPRLHFFNGNEFESPALTLAMDTPCGRAEFQRAPLMGDTYATLPLLRSVQVTVDRREGPPADVRVGTLVLPPAQTTFSDVVVENCPAPLGVRINGKLVGTLELKDPKTDSYLIDVSGTHCYREESTQYSMVTSLPGERPDVVEVNPAFLHRLTWRMDTFNEDLPSGVRSENGHDVTLYGVYERNCGTV